MNDIAALISAIASLLWPLFAFAVLALYRKQLGDLIARFRKGKLLGQEFELDESLNKLEQSATAVAEEVAALPASVTNDGPIDPTDDPSGAILREASRSPKAALLLLASELERQARQLLASVGHLKGQKFVPLSQALEVLQKQFGGLPGHIPSSLKLFWEVRNRLVHGGQADDEEILRAIDSGITILKALRAFPRETNYVYHPGVEVFKDPGCSIPWQNTKGVILETETPGGTQRFFRIFPTTRAHFQTGRRVAWEWGSGTIWNDAWYKDPDSGEIKLAWNSSMEFVGRHLEDV
ncbi:MAG TPA: hypothetical protein PLS22_05925 [Aquabacterium sp.]|nr:hypothetical protein [Aquabacterium sp.]